MILWEIYTETVPFNNKVSNALEFVVKEASRPKIPDYIPIEIKDIIRECWQEKDRTITFSDIHTKLVNFKN